MTTDPYDHRGALSAGSLLRGGLFLVRLWQSVKSWHRADEQEQRIRDSLHKVEEAHSFLTNPTPSGLLGDARPGTLQDAAAAGLLDPRGFYLGALEGTPLFYRGGAHLLTYGRTGGGKGRDVILPNLAHIDDLSLLVVDVKDGENAYASARHRRHTLGNTVVCINPWGLLDAGTVRLNPLARLVRLAAAGERIELAAREIAQILVPAPKKAAENAWVYQGAQRLLALRLTYLAYERPAACLLSSLWRFVNQGQDELLAALGEMMLCDRITVSGAAAAFFSLVTEAPKQWEAYRSEVQVAVDAYEPGSELEAATATDEFDLGPLFLLDEIAQLPPMPGLMKALRLYRGRGLQLWFFCQGRFSLEERYPREIVQEIEDQAAVFQMLSPEDPSLLKDIETWSGKQTVAVRGVNRNGGQVEGLSMGISEQARPVLQAEDIRTLGDTRQLLKLPGFPLFVADRIPFYEIHPFRDQLGDVRDLVQRDVVLPLD